MRPLLVPLDTTGRDPHHMDMTDTEPILTEDFVRAAILRKLPARHLTFETQEMGIGTDDAEPARRYLSSMVDGGWALPSWPRQYGGRDADKRDLSLIEQVRSEFAVPDLYIHMIGLHMVGPTILDIGTREQCDQWLPGIADGSEIWCQLFSEPEAGSDLANLGLRADLDGDSWILRGQKVWVSRAVWAKWGFVLARTGPKLPKHHGLTAFAVDMSDPGIDIRPLRQMNDDHHFSEVFVNDAVVPDSWRVGDVNSGWNVAMSLLARERSIAGKVVSAAWNEMPTWMRKQVASSRLTGVQRDRVMRVFVQGAVAQLASTVRASPDGQPGSVGSLDKLRKAALFKAESNLRLELLGADGMLRDSPAALAWLTSPSMSMRGGTDQVQRNIVGERLLGLPSEPRLDRAVSWAESRRGVALEEGVLER
jgi:alkylation response protein AidB-like acyl-CoA dehydrogenase